MGYAEITHPFHPLRGQSFLISKMVNISGIETIFIRHPNGRNFAVPREWTDQAEPSPPKLIGGSDHVLEPYCLLKLVELTIKLKDKEK